MVREFFENINYHFYDNPDRNFWVIAKSAGLLEIPCGSRSALLFHYDESHRGVMSVHKPGDIGKARCRTYHPVICAYRSSFCNFNDWFASVVKIIRSLYSHKAIVRAGVC